MKMILLVIIFALFTKLILSQNLIYPNLPSDKITDVHFLNESEILFINEGGSIYKSYDGGLTWDLKRHFQGESFASMEFIDNFNGFILPKHRANIGTSGLITTIDAGETWEMKSISVSTTHDFVALSKSISLKSSWFGEIQRLDNFYNEWEIVFELPKYTIVDPEFGEIEYSYGFINNFNKISESEIFALGLNYQAFDANIIQDSLTFILKSIDSGLTWDTLWIGLNKFAEHLSFASKLIGWFNAEKDIYKTIDGGITWGKIVTGISYNFIRDITVLDENTIYILVDNYKLIKSTDSGQSWQVFTLDVTDVEKITFFNGNYGIAYGKNLSITNNAGANWNTVHNPIKDNIYAMSFINKKIGVAAGGNGIYKTVNGGGSWEIKYERDINFEGNWNIELLENSIGWCVSYENIYKSIDQGESWEGIKLSNKPQLYDGVSFYNNYLGIIYGVAEETEEGSKQYEYKYNYITTDGGMNWNPVAIDTNSYVVGLEKVKFLDPEYLLGSNRNGLWLSRDTTKTWERLFDAKDMSGNLTFDFYDSLFGVLYAGYSDIYSTIDGGKNWKHFFKPVNVHPQDCRILGPNWLNEQRILECGGNGVLNHYNFSSAGELLDSRQLQTFTNNGLLNIEVVVDDNFPNVWISGGEFTILFREYEKILVNVNSESSKIPFEYSLSQNYPNPFNPSTTINYTIPSVQTPLLRGVGGVLITLKVYDILGSEVATLVNKQQMPGNYEVQFDASHLTSGIYFYKLQAGTFSESKKMIILK